jgi:hypothetical protein
VGQGAGPSPAGPKGLPRREAVDGGLGERPGRVAGAGPQRRASGQGSRSSQCRELESTVSSGWDHTKRSTRSSSSSAWPTVGETTLKPIPARCHRSWCETSEAETPKRRRAVSMTCLTTARFALSDPESARCSSISRAATCTAFPVSPNLSVTPDSSVASRLVSPAPSWLTDDEYAILSAACARLIPADETPGALEAGVPDYIDGMLGAFEFDPPRIWAGGPTSGRRGGEACFSDFHRLSQLDELAWRTRIEGSRGLAEREFNGPVVGLQEQYRTGLAQLGGDFCDVSEDEQDARLREHVAFTALLYEQCCEGMYAAPEYGGNRDLIGWSSIGYAGDAQPRGYTDAEVSEA